MGLNRWQLVILLLIGTVLFVRCHEHHKKESEHEEDGGEKEHADHFKGESHKGDKGFHKKVSN